MQDHPYLTAPRLIVWISIFLLFILLMSTSRRAEPSYRGAILVHQYRITESSVI